MAVLGVDPGLDGALVWLTYDGAVPVVEAVPMPTLATGRAGRRTYDHRALIELLDEHGTEFAILEAQGARPGQGVTSTFAIGFGFGCLAQLLASARIPHEVVRPQLWQREFAIAGSANTKQAALAVAQRLFPGVDLRATERCRTPHQGVVDALLMAEFGRRRR
jgi:hypothetical protein